MRRPQHRPVVTYGAQAEAVEKPKAKGRQVIPLERAQPASDMAVDGIMAALAVVANAGRRPGEPARTCVPSSHTPEGPTSRNASDARHDRVTSVLLRSDFDEHRLHGGVLVRL